MPTSNMTLGEAVSQNCMRVVREYIESSADPNVSADGLVPLREACFNENIPMMKYLLAHGADPNARDPDSGESILESLIWNYRRVDPHCRKIEKLAKKTYTYDTPANTAIFRRLLRAGADPNLPTNAPRPMFHWAIFQNVKRVVSILIEYGADVNERGSLHGDETPIMIAAYYADIGIMEKLLECGADPNARDKNGHNALFYVIAGMRHEDEIARFELLYRYGIDLHARDKRGDTILQFISHDGYNNSAIARWLRAHDVKE